MSVLRSIIVLGALCAAAPAADYRLAPVAEHHGVGSFAMQEASMASEAISGRVNVSPGAVLRLTGTSLSVVAPFTLAAGALQQPDRNQLSGRGSLSVPFEAQFQGVEFPLTVAVGAVRGEPEKLDITRADIYAVPVSATVSIANQRGKAPLVYPVEGKLRYWRENALPNARLNASLLLVLPGADAGKVVGKKEKEPRVPESIDLVITLVAIGD